MQPKLYRIKLVLLLRIVFINVNQNLIADQRNFMAKDRMYQRATWIKVDPGSTSS